MRKRNISFIADKLLWFIILLLPVLFALIFTCASMNNYQLDVNNDELNFIDYQYTIFSDTSDVVTFYGIGSSSLEVNLIYIPNSVNSFVFSNPLYSDGFLEFERVDSIYSDFDEIQDGYGTALVFAHVFNSSYNAYRFEGSFISSIVADYGNDVVSVGGISTDSFSVSILSYDDEFLYGYVGSVAELPSNDNIFKTYFNNLNYSLDSWFTFGDRDIVYNAFNSIFGSQSNIIPIFVEGSFIPKYLTYMAWIYVLHLVFDFLVFIPRLAHKWMGGVYNDEDSK